MSSTFSFTQSVISSGDCQREGDGPSSSTFRNQLVLQLILCWCLGVQWAYFPVPNVTSGWILWWGIGDLGPSSKLEIYEPRSLSSSLYFSSRKGLFSPGN